MKYLAQFSRYFVGILFIISGLIKLNDPIGTAIKMQEYFEVFAEDIAGFFHLFIPAALFFALLMVVLEVVLGVALLFYYRANTTIGLLIAIIGFFTFLTFYSAVFDKVTDCGCFGDALKLTPWQSFGKDVVLCIFILFLFLGRNQIQSSFNNTKGDVVMAIVTAISIYVGVYCINHLPIIDFRAYKVGDNIQENMTLPEGAKQDVYQTMFTLEHIESGEVKVMDDKEYMSTEIWKDTTWKFVKADDPVLIQKGDSPKITDYKVVSEEGDDVTSLTFEGKVFAIIIHFTGKADVDELDKIKMLVDEVAKSGVKPMIFTASSTDEILEFRNEAQIAAPIYFVDATVLKTIIRSNPGLWYLEDGIVKGKWHYNDVPDAAEIKAL